MAKNSTDILEDILLDLEILIEEQSNSKDNKNIDAKEINLKIEGHEDVVALLTGLGALGGNDDKKSAKNVADDVEALSNSLKAIADMDADKIKGVGESMKILLDTISADIDQTKLSLTISNVDALLTLSNASVSTKGLIELAEGLQYLSEIDVDANFLKKMQPLLIFLGLAAALGNNKDAAAGMKSFLASFGPIIALKLRFFLYQMSKIKDGEDLQNALFALGLFMNILLYMGEHYKEMKKGLKTISIVSNIDEEVVLNFTGFFNTLLSGLPKKSKLKEADKQLAFLKEAAIIISDLPLMKLLLLSTLGRLINKKGSESIAGFFKALVEGLPNSREIKQANKQLEFLKDASIIVADLPMMKLLLVSTLGRMLSPKVASKISEFIVCLINPISKIDKEVLLAASNIIDSLGNMILKIVLAIGLMMLLVAIDLPKVIISTVIVLGIIAALLGIAKLVGGSKEDGSLLAGTQGLAQLNQSILYVVLAIGLMTLLVTIFDLSSVLIATGIVLVVVLALIGMSKLVGSKDAKKEIDSGIQGMEALCKCLLFVVAGIAIMALLITLFDVSSIIIGAAIVIGIIFILIGIVKLISSIDEKKLLATKSTLWTLLGLMTIITLLALFAFPPIAENAEDVLIGAGIVVGIVVVLALITFALSLMDTKSLKQSAMTMVVLTAIVLVISLIAMFILVPLADQWEKAAIGSIVVLGIIGVMTLIVWGLSKIDEKNLAQGTKTLAAVTLIVLVISLIAMYLLVPIGKQWDNAAIGGAVVLGIIAIMTLMIFGLSKIKMNDVRQAEELLAVMTIVLLAVSFIVKEFFIPIGKEAKEAMYGGGIVLSVIALIAAINVLLTKIVKTIDLKDLDKANTLLGVMTIILWAISAIVKKYFIPIGQYGKESLIGAAIVISTLALITAIGIGASYLSKVLNKSDLLKGAAILAGVTAIIYLISQLMPDWVELCVLAYENKTASLVGGGIIIATLVVFGALMAGIGALTSIIPYIVIGGVILTGISGVLTILSLTLTPFFDLVQKVANMSVKDVVKGQLIIAATLVAFGALMAGIGALIFIIPFIAIGAVVLTGIAGTLALLSKVFTPYLNLVKKVNSTKDIQKATNDIIKIISKFGAIVAALGLLTLIPFFGLGLTAGVGFLAGIAAAMLAVKSTMHSYADVINTFSKLKPADRQAFEKYMTDTKNGFVGTMNKIIGGLNDLSLYAVVMAGIIAANLRPIFMVIADFMKVIETFGQLKIVTEWDKNGKPVAYAQMTPLMFIKAAVAVSSSFALFIKQLGKAMKEWNPLTAATLKTIAESLNPVMLSVGSFVDAICKFITMNIADEWDKEGKPTHFRHVNVEEFGKAADTIADSFCYFLTTLADKLAPLSFKALLVMNALKDGIEPVMNAVKSFTDAIMSVAMGTIQEVTLLDANGNPILDKNGEQQTIKKLVELDPKKFEAAATTITDCFVKFLDTLYKAFSEWGGESNWDFFTGDKSVKRGADKMSKLIESLSNIGLVVDGVVQLTSFIIEKATEMEKIDLAGSSQKMANALIRFLDTLKAKLQVDDDNKSNYINTAEINKQMGNVNKIINAYKKLYDLIKKMVDAATVFQTGIDAMMSLLNKLSESETVNAYNVVQATMDSTILPVILRISELFKFFSNLEIGSVHIDAALAKTNVKLLTSIIDEFTKALQLYNDAPKEFSLDIIQLIGTNIVLMYKDAELSYAAYYQTFAGITKKYTKDIKASVIPSINSLIKGGNALYKIFKALDKQLLDNQKKRDEALKKLTEQIKEMGSATAELASNLKKVETSAKDAAKALNDLNQAKSEAAAKKTTESVVDGVSQALTGNKKDAKASGNVPGKKKVDPNASLPEQIAASVYNAVLDGFAAAMHEYMRNDHQLIVNYGNNNVVKANLSGK